MRTSKTSQKIKSTRVVIKNPISDNGQNEKKTQETRQRKMEIINLSGTNDKLIRIDKKTYLVNTENIYECTEVLYSENFIRAVFKNGLGQHLLYSGAFVVHQKLLQVEISFAMKSGIMGDYLNLKARYDEMPIGEFNSLRCYLGYSQKGTWPVLNGDNWAVRIVFTQPTDAKPEGYFSILYFKKILKISVDQEDAIQPGEVPLNGVGNFLIQNKYTLNEITQHRKIVWSYIIKDKDRTGTEGILSCCCYPGFQYYLRKRDYVRLNDSEKPFISYAVSKGTLFTLEFESNEQTEKEIPWHVVTIE